MPVNGRCRSAVAQHVERAGSYLEGMAVLESDPVVQTLYAQALGLVRDAARLLAEARKGAS